MNIHCLQHVPFEGLGYIETWIAKNKHHLTYTYLFEKADFPDIKNVDLLIIMGGPMSTYDEATVPWLIQEKAFIKKAIDSGKLVLGICLGAQLIANVLGAKVYPNKQKEIGWFPVTFNPSFKTITNNHQNNDLKVFHWHGDTFDIPEGAINHAYSSVCKNQLFSYNQKVIGIQFHLESTPESVKWMTDNGGDELTQKGDFIQSEKEIQKTTDCFVASNKLMVDILHKLTT